MAKPQTENGFVMVALDLFAALMMADLPNRCMIVLSFHLIHSYGPSKTRDILLDPLTISEHTHLHPNNVRRAVKELVAANMLQRQKGGAYRFNKDYESWKPGGKALGDRLGGGPLEFAAWALTKHGKPIKPSAKDAIQPDCKPIKPSAKDAIQPDSGINDEPNPTGLPPTSVGNPTGLRPTKVTESNGIATFTDGIDMDDGINHCEEMNSDEVLARDRRRAPKNLDLEKNLIHIQAGSKSRAPNLRDPDDLAEVNEAIRFLGSYPNTEHIAQFLGQMHNTQDIIGIKGWRWIVAAHRVAKRTNARRLGFEYLTTVAVNATRADLDDIRAEAALIADTSDVDTPAASQLTRKRTQAEERKAQSEAMRRAIAEIADDEED